MAPSWLSITDDLGAREMANMKGKISNSEIVVVAETAAYLTGQPVWLWKNIVRWRVRHRPELSINLDVLVKSQLN